MPVFNCFAVPDGLSAIGKKGADLCLLPLSGGDWLDILSRIELLFLPVG